MSSPHPVTNGSPTDVSDGPGIAVPSQQQYDYLSDKAKENTLPTSASLGDRDPTRIKNRRNKYLQLNPGYFQTIESADPILYDRLIRQFQSAQERQEEGRKKGYAGVLEADLWRGEAKLARALDQNPLTSDDGVTSNTASDAIRVTYKRSLNGEITEEDRDDSPVMTQEEGLERWREIMGRRFVQGRDEDFDYKVVDNDEKYDDLALEEREAEEKWFDSETPVWLEGGDEAERGAVTPKLVGETGVQDF